jgi:hypothetical protein
MFGGGGGGRGYYKQVHNTDINWNELNKLLVPTMNYYKLARDSWKFLCYLSDSDFDADCKIVKMTNFVFFNFIILLNLIKENKSYTNLKNYFDTNHPGLFDSNKNAVEQTYDNYIEKLKQKKVFVSNSDY